MEPSALWSFFQNRRESQKLIVDTAFKDYALRFRAEAESRWRRKDL
jgi:hypothetical protein